MPLRTQVLPASSETYTGAFPVLEIGLGVNAEATMTWGLATWTARKGSLSWLVSPMRLAGIKSTTLAWAGATTPALTAVGDCPRPNTVPAVTTSTVSASARVGYPGKALMTVVSPMWRRWGWAADEPVSDGGVRF